MIEFDKVDAKDFDDLKGHNYNAMKFAMTVAVAGRHNILDFGSPGCGRSLLMTKFPLLMPKLTADEKESVKRIYDLAGLSTIVESDNRPFRMPHQTSSIEGMCGGGVNCRPGEISLAHNGMLFLDEAAEFRTSVLQMLRVPLENHQITLCRAGRTTIYPAKFQLAMSVNSCPCGNYGNKERICLCSARSIEQYWKKFSGPLLDRVDIRINFNEDYTKEEMTDKFSFTLDELRDKIAMAQTIQYERQGKLNADLVESEMERFCHLSNDALKALDAFCDVSGISTRGRKSLIKVARTLADFDESDTINKEHMSLALALRDDTPIGN